MTIATRSGNDCDADPLSSGKLGLSQIVFLFGVGRTKCYITRPDPTISFFGLSPVVLRYVTATIGRAAPFANRVDYPAQP